MQFNTLNPRSNFEQKMAEPYLPEDLAGFDGEWIEASEHPFSVEISEREAMLINSATRQLFALEQQIILKEMVNAPKFLKLLGIPEELHKEVAYSFYRTCRNAAHFNFVLGRYDLAFDGYNVKVLEHNVGSGWLKEQGLLLGDWANDNKTKCYNKLLDALSEHLLAMGMNEITLVTIYKKDELNGWFLREQLEKRGINISLVWFEDLTMHAEGVGFRGEVITTPVWPLLTWPYIFEGEIEQGGMHGLKLCVTESLHGLDMINPIWAMLHDSKALQAYMWKYSEGLEVREFIPETHLLTPGEEFSSEAVALLKGPCVLKEVLGAAAQGVTRYPDGCSLSPQELTQAVVVQRMVELPRYKGHSLITHSNHVYGNPVGIGFIVEEELPKYVPHVLK